MLNVTTRGLILALLLMCASIWAQQAPLKAGATREQVLARYGEPESQMVAGVREVLIFARARVVLRNGIVEEVQEQLEVPVKKKAPATVAPAIKAPPPAPVAAKPASVPAPPPTVVEPKASPPAAPISAVDPVATKPSPTPVAPATAPAKEAVVSPPPPVADSEPVKSTPASAPLPVVAKNAAEKPALKTTSATPKEKTVVEAAPAVVSGDKGTQKQEQNTPVKSDGLSLRTWLLLFLGAGGLAIAYWRFQKRRMELALAAALQSPSEPASNVPTDPTMRFTLGLLGKLEWKRFEQLVAQYYTKTGESAKRTGAGPDAPINIHISWKDDPRPFAGVRCVGGPVSIVDLKTLQALFEALTRQEIKRGYAVTTGSFQQAAREFAVEKGLALIPGDSFVEKLNALPEQARAELLRETIVGDFTTPTCPRCDVKMVKSNGREPRWVCPNRPTCEATIEANLLEME